jgi:hypothetical protein
MTSTSRSRASSRRRALLAAVVVIALGGLLIGSLPVGAEDSVPGSDPTVAEAPDTGIEVPVADAGDPQPGGTDTGAEAPADDSPVVDGGTNASGADTASPSSTPAPTAAPATGGDEAPAPPPAPNGTATIASDKDDYAPGDHVVLTGSGWDAGEGVAIAVDDSNGDVWSRRVTVTADDHGRIRDEFDLPARFVATYLVRADGLASGKVAVASFTDSIGSSFSQCANGKNGGVDCKWINGILNPNNSEYEEGMSVPQRVLLTGVPTNPNPHTLTFFHHFTKGGHYAFDFLTSWSQAAAAGLGSNIGFSKAIACADLGGLKNTCESLIDGGHFVDIPVPDDPFIGHNGPVQSRIDAYESGADLNYGNRTVRVYSNAAVSGAFTSLTHSVASGADTGDSDINYSLGITTTGSTIMVLYAGHLAVGNSGFGDSWGAGWGASSISGGPYHHQLDKLDGSSLGSQDNQIMASAVAPAAPQGGISITKDADPEDNTPFGFTATGTGVASSFSLTDPAANTQSWSGLGQGTYTFTENAVAGWTLVDIDCTTDASTTVTKNVAGRTVTIGLSKDGSAACTFRNVKRAGLTVIKHTNPSGSSQQFGFAVSGTDDYGNVTDDTFSRADGGSKSYSLLPGSITATETPVAGWDLTSVACTDDATHATVGTAVTNGKAVTLAAGQNVTCDFTNRQRGSIVVTKHVNSTRGDKGSFTFGFTGGLGSFSLQDGQSTNPNYTNLVPGDYTFTESSIPAGFAFSSVTCTGGSYDTVANGATVHLGAGQNVSCTVNNDDVRSTLVIQKVTHPSADPTLFPFTTTVPGGGSFSLGDGGSQSFVVVPGSYNATESVPAGWQQTDVSCVGGSASPISGGVSVTVPASSTVTCTFTNTKEGSIRINKETVPDAAAGSFGFTGDLGAFDLSDGQHHTASHLLPGDYSVAETVPAGWDLTGLDCSDGSNRAGNGTTIHLSAGENVVCTFTNTQRGSITIVKNTDPGATGSFDYTGDLGAFTLPGGGSQTFDNLVPGTYGVTESAQSGWTLTGLSCTDGSSTNVATRTATIGLSPGEHVTCTYSNTKHASLTIVKQTLPDGSSESFHFTGAASFDLTDGQSHAITGLLPGDYSVAESVPAGWTLTGLSCTDGSERDGNGVTVGLSAGENVTCTFTNTAQGGITVIKHTLPEGSEESFHFTGDLGGFDLTDGQSHTETGLLPGSFSVAEDVPAGWDLTGLECSDGSQRAADGVTVDLAAGEHVTCTFTNTQRGSLTVVKQTLPDGSEESFHFTGDLGGFDLTDGGHHTAGDLVPGGYTVNESPTSGWQLTDLTCDDGSQRSGNGVTVDVAPGENVTCTFTNTQEGSVTIEKQTLPDGSTRTFHFGGDLGSFDLTDGGSHTADGLLPGDYSVAETVPAGWDLTGLECSDGSQRAADGVTIDLAAGEHVTCTFTNTQRGSLTVVKQTLPEGSEESFHFTGDLGGFDLTDGGQHTAGNLVPGDYSVSEDVPGDWVLTGMNCDDGSERDGNGVTVTVSPGEDVTCTFTNTQNGSITIVKDAGDLANGEYSFDFTTTENVPGGSFTLTPAADTGTDAHLVGGLQPGSYGFDEVVPEGWSLDSVDCGGPETDAVRAFDTETSATGVVVGLAAGQNVVCTFRNTALPSAISIVKTANPTETKPGNTVTYTYEVTNTGETTLHDITLVDDKLGPITLDTTTLAPGESTTAHATYVVQDSDLGGADVGTIVNVAVVHGTDPLGRDVTDDDTATVDVAKAVVEVAPGIHVDKVPSTTTAHPGDVVTYAYTVTNTGGTVLTDVTLVDDKLGPITLDKTTLQPQESTHGSATHMVTEADATAGSIVNIALASGQPPSGDRVTDKDTATVTVTRVPERQPVVPFTGTMAGRLLWLAAVLLMVGSGIRLSVRRRRRPTA